MDKILGIGNALTDVSVILKSDDILTELGLPKGGMVHIDDVLFKKIQQMIGQHHVTITPGGSIANSCRAMGHLGVPAGFVGKVGHDKIGQLYARSLTEVGVEDLLVVSPNLSSGVCTSFISQGGERTFADHMEASIDLKAEDLNPGIFNEYNYLFLEGYLVQNHELIEQGAKMAKEAGMKVAMDLASYNIILEDHEFCTYLVNKYEMGVKGSIIATKEELSEVHAQKANCIDSTGAGDCFAGGFLYGLVNGHNLKQCAEIGSIIAAEIVQVVGTELPQEKWIDIKHKIAEI